MKPKRTAPAASAAAGGATVVVAMAVTVVTAFLILPGVTFPLDTPRFVGLMIAAGLWAFAWSSRAVRLPDTLRLRTALFLVAAVTVVSAALSTGPGLAFTWGAEGNMLSAPAWLAMMLIFLVTGGLALGDRRVMDLLAIGTVLASAAAVWGISDVVQGKLPSSVFGNGNYLGPVLLLFLPVAVHRARTDKESGSRIAWIAAAVVLVVGAIASDSQTAQAVLAVEIVALGLLTWRYSGWRKPSVRTGRRLAIAAVAIALVAGVWGLASPDPLASTLRHSVTRAPTTLTRVEFWKVAWSVFRDHPVLGVGPDGLPLASQKYLSLRTMELEAGGYTGSVLLLRDPHDLPMLVLAELGVVGFAALVWLALEWAFVVRTRLRDQEDDRFLRLTLVVCVASFFATQLLVPWTIRFGALVPLLAGLAVAPMKARAKGLADRTGTAMSPTSRAIIALVIAVAGVSLAVTALAGDASFARGRRATDRGEAMRWFETASRWQPTRAEPRYEVLYALGDGIVSGETALGEYQGRVNTAPEIVRENGVYLANLVQPALDEAVVTSRTDLTWETGLVASAAQLAPNHPDTILEEAHLALAEGDLNEARDLLGLAVRIGARGPRSILYRLLLASASGDTAAERRLTTELGQTAPWFHALVPARR
ncbi:MAG: O-antigen ligase family protein [Coriobacteriia bacterium]